MKAYLQKTTSPAPLALFRMALGMMLFLSIVRFWTKGWIHELYIEPNYHFPFYGFQFVRPLGEFTYVIFIICAVAALMVALGWFYRASIITLFLSFTYIELIDKSTYLNHYYFISMICLLMIFLPAHAYFSMDAHRNRDLNSQSIPLWCIDSVKLFVCMIYIFAGLAKINTDWLLHAQPLRIWLPAKNDMPFIGFLFNYTSTAYVFSWAGCIYDLTIPFLLLNNNTRWWAFGVVVVFHLLTAMLFPIGMFPYIMIVTASIFFPVAFHEKMSARIALWLHLPKRLLQATNHYTFNQTTFKFLAIGFFIFFTVQVALPFRYLFYPGELFWTEQGYRFSWRVMLMEKSGYAQFTVTDHTGKKITVDNNEFLTPLQQKMMATQPDMILQYAHMLRDYYEKLGYRNPSVFVDSYVAVNGRLGKALVDPKTDLAKKDDSLLHKSWILPFNEKIAGF
ncbi:MAG: HTTM domain-containing protein [Cyclobacteriaceae bacterium]